MTRVTLYSLNAYAAYRAERGLLGASRSALRVAIRDGRINRGVLTLRTTRGNGYAIIPEIADEEMRVAPSRTKGNRLSEEDVVRARQLYETGLRTSVIAKELQCTSVSIRHALVRLLRGDRVRLKNDKPKEGTVLIVQARVGATVIWDEFPNEEDKDLFSAEAVKLLLERIV